MGTNNFKVAFTDGASKTASLSIDTPKDVIMFVAGTTDPINTSGLKHQANSGYWRPEKEGINNLWKSVKKLKPQFLDLHIEDTFFSWSGDNNKDERVKAANRLLDLFLRLYPNWKTKQVYLHLIGHSHGGNVINEFTNIIADSPDFPKLWKIKSITYLSTPFFSKQHQLNHSKLHSKCKIINVHNEYDITQRFVADFTLENLEILLANFDGCKLEELLKGVEAVDFTIYEELGIWHAVDNTTEGPHMWEQTIILLDTAEKVVGMLIESISYFKVSGPLYLEKEVLTTHLEAILAWATTQKAVFIANRATRDGGYGRGEFLEDLNLLEVLRMLNVVAAIDTTPESSYLLTTLNNIIQNKDSNVVQIIDDTNWHPKDQVNGAYEIVDVPITNEDPYDSRGRKSNYDRFINGVEKAVKAQKNDLREVIMRLLSQMIAPGTIGDIGSTLDSLMWLYTDDDIDDGLRDASANFNAYEALIAEYHEDLVVEADQENEKLEVKPGSLPYLAKVSHSLSHTQLWPKVEAELKKSFGSKKNPGYKEN